MDSTHPLAPLEANFVHSLKSAEPNFPTTVLANFNDVVGDDFDFSRGLMLAFPSIWKHMTPPQRLEAIYIAACIERGIEIPFQFSLKTEVIPHLDSPTPIESPSPKEQPNTLNKATVWHTFLMGTDAERIALISECGANMAAFISGHDERVARQIEQIHNYRNNKA